MKDYKEMDKLVFDFGDDIKYFAQNHGGTMPPMIKTQLQDLMYTYFGKEIDAIVEREELEIKFKKKFYDKLLKAKLRLAKLDRADAWFDRVFQKYFSRGILEHLIIHAIRFLRDKDLFSPKRLFTELNDNELLAQFITAACEYLGWAERSEPVSEETEEEETPTEEDETPADEEQNAEVTVYEPQPVAPFEEQPKAVVKVERTVTHEVVTATQQADNSVSEADNDDEADVEEESDTSLKSDEKVRHNYFRPGGKSSKNS